MNNRLEFRKMRGWMAAAVLLCAGTIAPAWAQSQNMIGFEARKRLFTRPVVASFLTASPWPGRWAGRAQRWSRSGAAARAPRRPGGQEELWECDRAEDGCTSWS